MWRGDPSDSAHSRVPSAVVQFAHRDATSQGSRTDRFGSQRRDLLVHPQHHRQARQAGRSALQQGPVHAALGQLSARALSECQIYFYGQRRPRRCPFDRHQTGKRFFLFFSIYPLSLMTLVSKLCQTLVTKTLSQSHRLFYKRRLLKLKF